MARFRYYRVFSKILGGIDIAGEDSCLGDRNVRIVARIAAAWQRKSAADVHHATRRLDEARLADMMPRLFLVDHCTNVISKLGVAGA